MIDIEKYKESLPQWHKHKQGHVIKILKYENGEYLGRFYNFASGTHIEEWASERYHVGCLERGDLTEIPAAELARYLLLDNDGL